MFGKFLVDRGLLSEADLFRALEEQNSSRPSVGRVAFELDLLTLDQVVEVLAAQESGELRFCAQAVALGFLDEDQRRTLLAAQEESHTPLGQIIATMGLLGPEVVGEELDAYHEQNGP